MNLVQWFMTISGAPLQKTLTVPGWSGWAMTQVALFLFELNGIWVKTASGVFLSRIDLTSTPILRMWLIIPFSVTFPWTFPEWSTIAEQLKRIDSLSKFLSLCRTGSEYSNSRPGESFSEHFHGGRLKPTPNGVPLCWTVGNYSYEELIASGHPEDAEKAISLK